MKLIVAILGYLIGSIPNGVIIAKIKNVNILHHGSGNTGATNVTRILGIKYGAIVFVLDFIKGFIPMFFWKQLAGQYEYFHDSVAFVLALALIVGHVFSIFLQFKGGKGVATTIGVLMSLIPCVTIIGIILWYSVFSITRFVSLASLCFAMSLPLNAYLFAYPKTICQLIYIISVCIFISHYKIILRLWYGTENRFEKKNTHTR